jgi:hypothetical protein
MRVLDFIGAPNGLKNLRIVSFVLAKPYALLDPRTNRSRGRMITPEQDERHFVVLGATHAAIWVRQFITLNHAASFLGW